jgi:hypothetical protein
MAPRAKVGVPTYSEGVKKGIYCRVAESLLEMNSGIQKAKREVSLRVRSLVCRQYVGVGGRPVVLSRSLVRRNWAGL